MSADNRTFRFRLRSTHAAPNRATKDLAVDVLNETGLWEPQHPSFATPGFRLYLISLLLCQHFALVANARDQQIPLQEVEAGFIVTTGSDWKIASVEGAFQLHLDPAATAEERARADVRAIAFLEERMKRCPVSRNLPTSVAKTLRVSLSR